MCNSKIRLFYLAVIVSLIITLLSACSVPESPVYKFDLNYSQAAGLSADEITEIQTYLISIAPKLDLSLSQSSYRDYYNASNKAAQVGIHGMPALAELAHSKEKLAVLCSKPLYDEYSFQEFYSNVFIALLRTDRNFWYTCAQENGPDFIKIPTNSFNNAADIFSTGTHSHRNYAFLWTKSQQEIPKIISSKVSFECKISSLKQYGLISIPFVVKEINKGHSEYEAYFTAIGLHMDTPEFMSYMTDYSLPWEERFEKEGFMDGAEDFDYRVWLSENEEDLENLFKFLDAYCAEYEAENKS